MNFARGFRCIHCGHEFGIKDVEYVCSKCGSNLDILYDYDGLKGLDLRKSIESRTDFSIWRYREFYPIDNFSLIPPLHIGWTPLYNCGRLGDYLGYSDFYIKDDGRNPSASFKDRAGAIVVIKARERGEKLICGASTGNAASSLSCLTASIGLKTIIFVPENAPIAKIAQLLVFGAKVIAVKGSYDDAFDLCLKATERYGWYNRNTGYNPYTREGKKSCSYEIAEQLAWDVPDYVFVPVGDGNIISGIWKGFVDLKESGMTDKLPVLIAVQAEGSPAVKNAIDGDGVIKPVKANTIADSISVDLPRDGEAAVKAVKESGGFAVAVSDDEILEAIRILGSIRGIFAEPAGSTSFAGLMKLLKGDFDRNKESVILVTGNGLKDIESAKKAVGEPFRIEPSIDELEKIVESVLE